MQGGERARAWVAVAAALWAAAVALVLVIDQHGVELGAGSNYAQNTRGLKVDANTTWPALQIQNTGTGDALRVLDPVGNPVLRVRRLGNESYTEFPGTSTFTGSINVESELQAVAGADFYGQVLYDVGNIWQRLDYVDAENQGLPTVRIVPITTTSKTVLTLPKDRTTFISGVVVRVTSNYNCTGDDCTLKIGDGNDDDGFCALADAQLQASDTAGTGFAAGFQCVEAATRGVYLDEAANAFGVGWFPYMTAAAAETIDLVIGGTNPTGGAGKVYVFYTFVEEE